MYILYVYYVEWWYGVIEIKTSDIEHWYCFWYYKVSFYALNVIFGNSLYQHVFHAIHRLSMFKNQRMHCRITIPRVTAIQ